MGKSKGTPKVTKAGRILPAENPTERVFSADQEADICRRLMRAESCNSIARLYKVHNRTIYRLRDRRIRPMLREMAKRPLEDIMGEITEIRRVAWKGYQATLAGLTEETVETALDEAKKGGKISEIMVKKVIRKLPNNTATAWLAVIQWCADFEAKIYGHYAPTKSQVAIQGDFRVAGYSPDQINAENLAKLDAAIRQNRAREIELRNLGMGSN